MVLRLRYDGIMSEMKGKSESVDYQTKLHRETFIDEP